MSSEQTIEINELGNGGPGKRLKAEREKQQISLADVVKKTNIPEKKLIALEQDNYAALGPELFTIGYIRKFAKVLGIESDELVDNYRVHLGELSPMLQAPPRVGNTETSSVKGYKSTRSKVKLPGPVEIAQRNIAQTVRDIPSWWIVIGLVVIWIVGVYIFVPASDPASNTRVDMFSQDDGSEPIVDTEDDFTETAEQFRVPSVETASLDPKIQSPANNNSESTALKPANRHPNEENTTLGPAMAGATIASSSVDNRRDSISAQAEGKDLLVMNFIDECWVEVNDVSGKVLFAALQGPEDTLQLFGKAPFGIMLGNALAVNLVVNGRAVSTEPEAGRKTLRITAMP